MTGFDYDAFFEAYLATACASDTETIFGTYPDDLDSDFLAESGVDCLDFCARFGQMIAGREAEAGHDFWLTRNGAGAGFWDGDWDEDHGDAMTEYCMGLKPGYLYRGDDGRIYGQYI